MRIKIPMPLSFVLGQQKKWRKDILKVMHPAPALPAPASARRARPSGGHLSEIAAFGSNPGHLRMFEFAPPNLQPGAPLVVVLHGCLQNAADFNRGSGWGALARKRGFVLLYPEQRESNNANLCFNWFRPSAIARDRGELMSIRQMIDHSCRRHRISPGRVYVQGLSAGGAMACALLATYPDLFAGGNIVAGLPFGAARDAMTALSVMKSGVSRTGREWGDLVRKVTPEMMSRPAISIWHGTADRVVSIANAYSTLRQWLDLYDLAEDDGRETLAEGRRIKVWHDQAGRPLIEFCLIEGLDHGLPVARHSAAAKAGGTPFMLVSGVSAPAHMVGTWLTAN
ncbi:MAG: extracellular catalytic domain type 1 short-chain-length polyhydroxyalkanoate depolymerase [Allorhizobium sp.]